ncbi:MAG: hypothetical protein RR133_04455 [Kiritimatiellia bacterium]
MKITTALNREYALRFLGVALFFAALAGWFLYDGRIGYPAENARIAPIAAELSARGLTPAEWMNRAKTGTAPLVEAFRAKGFKKAPAKISDAFASMMSVQDPKADDVDCARAIFAQPIHSEEDIHAQFISAALGLAAGFLLLGIVLRRWVTRFTLDTETPQGPLLTVTRGTRLRSYPLSALTAVEEEQWKKRGILRLLFDNERITLDAWHYRHIREIASFILTFRA